MALHEVDVTHQAVSAPAGIATAGSALWMEIRPDLKRGAVIASDILAGLGKRRDVAGLGRNQAQDTALAKAWLRAYDIEHLVATEAQRLTPLLLRYLVTLASDTGLQLWLLHRSPRDDVFLRGLTKRGAHPMQVSDVPAAQHQLALEESRPTLAVYLPAAGFHQFLSACRDNLNATDHSKVLTRHRTRTALFEAALHRDGANIKTIALLMEQVLRPAPHDDLLTIDLRALQTACWQRDLYVKTDLPTLLASPERQQCDPEIADRALMAYRQPHRAVAVALAAQQVGVTDTHALRITDAHPDGTLNVPDGRRLELGEHTRRALRALLLLRKTQGAQAHEPLLNVKERAISSALIDANSQLDIRVHGRRAERHVHPRRWLTALGLTVASLT